MKIILLFIVFLICTGQPVVGQNFTEILGRPTNSAITMSILFDQPVEVFWEYGTSTGIYSLTTATYTTAMDTALEVDFVNLATGSKYFYRTRYRPTGSSMDFLAGPERTFHTQRSPGSNFTFAIEADPHLDTNSSMSAYALTLQNVLLRQPDFLFDLGDIFMSEKLPVINQTNITSRHLLYRPFLGAVCHSVPLYLVIGNHEGENGWRLDGTPNSLPVLATNTRKLFYPNPFPNSFYSGNVKTEPFVGLRENYYSWEWGNALFIVLDPYWNTTVKPGWGWTLGEDQYNWFKNVITTSQAKFKFVFCHQLVGGNGNDGRGGSEFAGFFENGGENADSTWGFDTFRPNWEKPLHTLMVENNANIFFHGHDHCYAKQDKDGVVYQEVPQPSSLNITNITGTQYGYINGVLMPSRGFILVTVADSTVKVDYIKAFLPNEATGTHPNGEVAYSYTISSTSSGAKEKAGTPGVFQLEQNYPNPFTEETSIKYTLLIAGNVQFKIFDLVGKELGSLVNRFQQPGDYSVSLPAGDLSLTNGIYYCRMILGNYSKTIKMICINSY
ncbi:MAG: metallophosphoesterase [Bacteroidetes bacterium]|nr:metallophosphoesterase [Bacteroidota bacterium]